MVTRKFGGDEISDQAERGVSRYTAMAIARFVRLLAYTVRIYDVQAYNATVVARAPAAAEMWTFLLLWDAPSALAVPAYRNVFRMLFALCGVRPCKRGPPSVAFDAVVAAF
ncbi:hypothetical protein HPB50_017681 [Hyalomma asiaticum]|uniref:Uncharacterized protein n=1 Tax=Hyalomma asiaticum TaxID=266040 RepID=A0ACB7SG92_HYAAI|nr:hypothetical protein HPB50_017681 [Hyalomma asiaticum]